VRPNHKVALVTGASTGIGQACAAQLASAGFAVYGTSRHPKPANGHGGIPIMKLDVRDDASVNSCMKRVLADSGRIDVLVNNAGVAMEGAVEETSLDEIRSVMETNFFGAVRMMKAVLPIMRKQGTGRIVNIGSMVAHIPMPFSASYCASKHALRGFSESLDHEVRNFGIRVSVVEPGFIKTEIVEHSPIAAAPFEPYSSARSKPARAFRKQIEQGHKPALVAAAVLSAATAEYPRLHYLPDGSANILAALRAVLPAPLFDFAFRKGMRIEEG